MTTNKNIGLIEGKQPGQSYQIDGMRNLEGYNFTKAFVTNNASEGLLKLHYPHVEIVDDRESILNDSSIELVIVSAPSTMDMDIVTEVLQAGKHVRIL